MDDYGLPWEESTPMDAPLLPPKYRSLEFINPSFYDSPVVLNIEFSAPPKPPKISLQSVEEAGPSSSADRGDEKRMEDNADGDEVGPDLAPPADSEDLPPRMKDPSKELALGLLFTAPLFSLL